MKMFWCFHLPLFWRRGWGRFLPRRSIFLSKSRFKQQKRIVFLKMKKKNFCYWRRVYWQKEEGFKFSLKKLSFFSRQKMKIFLYTKNGAFFLHFSEIRVLSSFIRYGSLCASKISSTYSILFYQKSKKKSLL